MATSSFDRKFEVRSWDSAKKLARVLRDDRPQQPLSTHPFSEAERERSEQLLKRYLSRSKH